MKIKWLPTILVSGFVACVALLILGCVSTARGFFSTIEVDVTASAVISYESYSLDLRLEHV